MIDRWSEAEAAAAVAALGPTWGEDLALRTYSARLLGREPALVLHGGGNTSVKGLYRDLFGDEVPTLFVKASGFDLATIEPEGHPGLALDGLERLRALPELSDDEMVGALRRRLHRLDAPTPSIEALAHAFLPAKFIDHTHADALLALGNRSDGERLVAQALGPEAVVLPYATPGFKLARTTAEAFEAHPGCRAVVWLGHGLLTWGETARDAYASMIAFVSRAEAFLGKRARPPRPVGAGAVDEAWRRYEACAPFLRGALSPASGDPDRPHRTFILRPLIDAETLGALSTPGARSFALTPPLTADHLIRTKPWPAWVDAPALDDPGALRRQVAEAVSAYAASYEAYLARNGEGTPPGADPLPRVLLVPGLGAVCAGPDARAADVARDITAHTLAAKASSEALGPYVGLSEGELYAMEHRGLQLAKLGRAVPALGGRIAVVTGAAGAIGSGLCEALLAEGCHLAATDLPGPALDSLAAELAGRYPGRVLGVPMDVTDEGSVDRGFAAVVREWGGVDLGIVNAGLAHVARLADLDLENFRRLERVNVEGTLLLLRSLARTFELQGIGGDVVLVSTKNVFAPGAQFGAYSATKAAAHQLARIASLELAGLGVRVNMVAPDAVFSHGRRPSGLWKEVGPDHMRARGLDEEGLEEYYRSRNLLKARVTAAHVAKAVLFFATRQTPTTGATLPVDGGLPDATPR